MNPVLMGKSDIQCNIAAERHYYVYKEEKCLPNVSDTVIAQHLNNSEIQDEFLK